MNRILFSLGIITSGLILGYVLQRLIESGRINPPIGIPSIRRGMQKIALWFFTPVPVVGAIWIARIDNIRLTALPFIGMAVLLIGGLLGWSAARLLGCDRKQTGTLYCCGSFSNIGSIGSLVGYVFLGEGGFAMIALYKMFEEVVYYGIGFPIAKYYGGEAEESEPLVSRLRKVFTDPFVLVALGALLMGTILNLSGIPRPVFFETVNAFFIPAGTLLLLVSIGLGMRFSQVGFVRESLLISGIKFMAMPLLAGTAAGLMGFESVCDGLPLKAVVVASSMPVAFNSLVAVSLYDLDLNLANSCWLVTTCALAVVLPWLHFLLERI